MRATTPADSEGCGDMAENYLYYGDNLDILQRYSPGNSGSDLS